MASLYQSYCSAGNSTGADDFEAVEGFESAWNRMRAFFCWGDLAFTGRETVKALVSHWNTNTTPKLNIFYPHGIHSRMPPTEAEKLMAEVKAWADQKRGRRSELARTFGVSPQLVTNWLAGRKMPTLDDGLKLQAFLRRERKSRRRK